jgi:hypothetical protein
LPYTPYNSFYEVSPGNSATATPVIRTAVDSGISWEDLSDMQKAYIILKIKGATPDTVDLDI